MSDWTTARVVRDGKGRLRTDDGPIRGLVGDGLVSAESAAAYEHMLGPFTPVLDADGLSVVRTVGDLTARHVGRRVRVEGVEGELVRIEFRPYRVAMTVVKPNGSRKYPRTGIYSPCEVIDA